ncbi:MAG: hypothetical protein WAO08_29270 [Hyphomicrobiaceae bacterium]
MRPEVQRQSAESQVIGLLRGEDTAEFDLRVSVRAGHWFLSLSSPNLAKQAGVAGESPMQGEGMTFAEAWHDIKPWWFDDPPTRGSNGSACARANL